MAEAHVQRASGSARGSKRLDLVLIIVVSLLVIAVAGVAAYFGWSIYQNQLRAEDATPALRVAKVLEEQVRNNPDDVILRVRYGEALAAAGKSQEAIAQFNAALKIDPEHTGAYLDLGLLAAANDRFAEAEEYLNEVIDITDGTEFENVVQRREQALYTLGLIKLDSKDYEEAAGYFKGALRIRKDASDTYYHLAKAIQGMGDNDEALRNLEIAISFDPKFAQAHYLMGQLYQDEGDMVNASYHYFFAAEAAPDADPPQEALAAIGTSEEWTQRAADALDAGEIDEALEAALIARNLDPENAEAAVVHGRVLSTRGDKKDALEVFKKAAELDPDDTEIPKKIEKLEAQLKSGS